MRDDPEERFDAGLPFVNGAALAAVALRRRNRGIFAAARDALVSAYRLGDVASDQATEEDMTLWDAANGALWSLGATAVQSSDWDAVRAVVVRQPMEGGYYATWLRHGQVMRARTTIDAGDDNVLDVGARRLALHPSFGMTDASPELRLRALCGFDPLALLVVADVAGTEHVNFYPSYAKHPVSFVEGFVIDLREEGAMRKAIFPRDDATLRRVLREANEMRSTRPRSSASARSPGATRASRTRGRGRSSAKGTAGRTGPASGSSRPQRRACSVVALPRCCHAAPRTLGAAGPSTAKALENQGFQAMARPGLEPGTPRFSVVCSTN